MDSAKVHLWRDVRNEPQLTHPINGQRSSLLSPPVGEYFLPGGEALFSTLSRALLEHMNYVSLPSFLLAV